MSSPESIIGDVAEITGVPAPAILGRRRTTAVLHARYLAIAALRQAFGWWAVADIAAHVRKDRGSAVNALRNHQRLICENGEYRAFAAALHLTLPA